MLYDYIIKYTVFILCLNNPVYKNVEAEILPKKVKKINVTCSWGKREVKRNTTRVLIMDFKNI